MAEVAISVRRLLEVGTGRLRLAGFPEPRRQAMRLWADLGGGGPAFQAEAAADRNEAATFERAISRRLQGEPLAYVTGRTGFRHLLLNSDRRALIPRPETEGLVDLLLQHTRSGLVADVGTGTGCIALSLATEGGFSRIVAVESSAEALALARLNRELVDAADIVELVRGDLCAPLCPEIFDALISNPPYLTTAEYTALDRSVRDWEPELALVGGEDGLQATIRLLDEARSVLRPGGWLALEIDCSRAAMAADRARGLGWDDVTIHVDLFGRERYLLAQRSETR
jgi:release factor glutamine methyltransferase